MVSIADPIPSPTPVDQGYGDVSPLQISLRVLQPSRRLDTAFEGLYRHPGLEGGFYRQAGGIYAVFDRSEYIGTRYGSVPVIPPGTTFYIGTPDWLSTEAAPRNTPKPRPTAVLDDVWITVRSTGTHTNTTHRHFQTNTISDESLRQSRLGDIAQRALAANG